LKSAAAAVLAGPWPTNDAEAYWSRRQGSHKYNSRNP